MSKGNEPAYPHTFTIPSSGGDATIISHGLTKREQIAAKAMQGLISVVNTAYFDQQTYKNVAIDAVNYADALMEALNGKYSS